MKTTLLTFFGICLSTLAWSQSVIPDSIRGRNAWVARGVMDGNLIETNFRNHGEISRFNDIPFGFYPRGTQNRHIDGIALYIAGEVIAINDASGLTTTIRPVSHNYRADAGGRAFGPNGEVWGWLPLPYFHNANRIANGSFEPIPPKSSDPSSWPDFWPDRVNSIDDPGWPGQWNGLFGKGVQNADLESFYYIDDLGDFEYGRDPNGNPFNRFGDVYAPDPADSTKGGLGLQVQVRLLQWANVLVEDLMFILYEITNVGGKDHTDLFFTQLNDYGLGNEEGDEVAEFNPQEDVVFGWDLDGIGTLQTGGRFPLAYTGFAFLESPQNNSDGIDNDEDGIIDERRDGGPGILIEGQNAIRAFVEANYDMQNFNRAEGPLEERPAFIVGRWWTGDENLDWAAFSDDNGNGIWDPGEFLNNDLGADGLGPFDLNYSGPDQGEGDGIPSDGEPNFDRLDLNESDMIGLRGFDLGSRQGYQAQNNLSDDLFLWRKFSEGIFPVGTEPDAELANGIEPFLMLLSGPVELLADRTDFFSTAWIFGLGPNNQISRDDFFKNRRAAQNIFEADYQFAQPPIMPTLNVQAGDKQVVLTWDTLSLASFDRFLQEFDFEGYKLYKGTDPLLSDARTITDASGIPTFFSPIAQFDLDNGIRGLRDALEGTIKFNLGSDSGLQFFFIDNDVINGVRYYYAIVAYDRGAGEEVDPQENTFNFTVDVNSQILGSSRNAQAVIPRENVAGFIPGGSNGDLSRPSQGIGTGGLEVSLVAPNDANFETAYEVEFSSEALAVNPVLYETTGYSVRELSSNEIIFETSVIDATSSVVEGFVVTPKNPRNFEIEGSRTGWVGNAGTENELFSTDPRQIEGLQTTWVPLINAEVDRGNQAISGAQRSPFDYELRWTEELYQTPRALLGTALRTELPFFAFNISGETEEQVEMFVLDLNESGQFDLGDDLLIAEEPTPRQFRFLYRIRFQVPTDQTAAAPSTGDRLRISSTRLFFQGDKFTFNVSPPTVDTELAKDDLERIKVVPNPYIGASIFEKQTLSFGRGQRQIRFTNLPRECTIKIFNVRGELIRTLQHSSSDFGGTLFWDLLTEERQDVAYGVYVFHVKAPGIGEKTGKFALIK